MDNHRLVQLVQVLQERLKTAERTDIGLFHQNYRQPGQSIANLTEQVREGQVDYLFELNVEPLRLVASKLQIPLSFRFDGSDSNQRHHLVAAIKWWVETGEWRADAYEESKRAQQEAKKVAMEQYFRKAMG